MKRRIIITSKILAVAAAVGCNQPAAGPAGATAAERPASTAPSGTSSSATSATNTGSAPAAAPAGAHAGAAPDPALIALREELYAKSHEEAFAALAHYRPLCDREGFPLVGNVIRKTPTSYKPSEFCSDLRKRGTP